MSRTITALFESRGEAEAAKTQLASAVKVESARVLAKETIAALDGLPINHNALQNAREALTRGGHILVAMVARGEKPEQIISMLTKARAKGPAKDEPKLSYEIGATPGQSERNTTDQVATVAKASTSADAESRTLADTSLSAPVETALAVVDTAPVSNVTTPLAADGHAAPSALPDEAQDAASKEIRVGKQQTFRGGASANTRTGERTDFESRAPARRVTDQEVEAGGLLKNRVIEVVEMREEPVIAREVVVREEVIIRKTVTERTGTVNETVRRTEVEVEELP